ncbi:hypothetical protein [Pyrolobus fumarii]|uniref:hypothetical protein n=1 Tax=Pyrolobus fumarii TaxID=54252 RepID=UPI0014332508|nr:hypothetical protein [Pyrolobus fumarii]
MLGFVLAGFAWLVWLVQPLVLLDRFPPDTPYWWLGLAAALIDGLAVLAVTELLVAAWRLGGRVGSAGPLVRDTAAVAFGNMIVSALAAALAGEKEASGLALGGAIIAPLFLLFNARLVAYWLKWRLG